MPLINRCGGGSLASPIFGTGSDGDVTISSDTALPVTVPHQSIVEKNYKSLTINAGVTLKCASWNAGLIIRVRGNCTIHGIIDQSGLAPKTNANNTYPYPSQLVCGDGGNGGAGGSGSAHTSGTNVGGTKMLKRVYGGGYGAGGGGGDGYNDNAGGVGGSSSSSTIDISSIFIGGAAGTSYNDGGAGLYGGGGGAASSNGHLGGAGGTGAGGSGAAGTLTDVSSGGGGAGNYGGGVVLFDLNPEN